MWDRETALGFFFLFSFLSFFLGSCKRQIITSVGFGGVDLEASRKLVRWVLLSASFFFTKYKNGSLCKGTEMFRMGVCAGCYHRTGMSKALSLSLSVQ